MGSVPSGRYIVCARCGEKTFDSLSESCPRCDVEDEYLRRAEAWLRETYSWASPGWIVQETPRIAKLIADTEARALERANAVIMAARAFVNKGTGCGHHRDALDDALRKFDSAEEKP